MEFTIDTLDNALPFAGYAEATSASTVFTMPDTTTTAQFLRIPIAIVKLQRDLDVRLDSSLEQSTEQYSQP